MISSGFTGENFYIVVSSFATITGFRPIECSATQGHCINVDLRGTAVFCGAPCVTAIDGRPLRGDVCAVFGSDGEHSAAVDIVGVFFFLALKFAIYMIAKQVMRMLFFTAGISGVVQIERYGILVALVVHVDDGGAVACDGLLRDRLGGGEALIRLGRGCGLRTGSAGHLHGFLIGVAVIICIFQPVNDGVLNVLFFSPVCGQSEVFS